MTFDQGSVMVLSVAVALALGVVFSRHFRALILLPAALIVAMFFAAISVFAAQNGFPVWGDAILVVVAIQGGYLLGSFTTRPVSQPGKDQLNIVTPN